MAVQTLLSDDVYKVLHTTEAGLSDEEASDRTFAFGPNVIQAMPGPSLISRILKQLTSLFALLLWLASFIAFAGEIFRPGEGFIILGLAIIAVIIINSGFAFYQGYRAEKAFEELNRLLPNRVRVIRGGSEKDIPASGLVPGDLVHLSEGDRVPADIRLLDAVEMRVDNSSLTGESKPAERDAEPHDNPDLLESLNIAFAGTSVLRGHGRGVVFATGMSTEFGKIALLTSGVVKGMTPLELETVHVTRTISAIAVGLGVLFFIAGYLIGRGFWENFIFALGILVANVPEGLLPTVTLSLSMASQRMAKKNALVRTLTSVETLGSVTVICTDKTGTLTQNRMRVMSLFTDNTLFKDINEEDKPGISASMILRTAIQCNDAYIRPGNMIEGDPTEKALLEFAMNYVDPDLIRSEEPRIAERPFDPFRKWMATVHEGSLKNMIYVKGAPETVLPLCSSILINQEVLPLTQDYQSEAGNVLSELTAAGMRVLAFAYKETGRKDLFEEINQLVFTGYIALEDPPRPEVPAAISSCREAGVKIIMITGDNPETARAIGSEIGLYTTPVLISGQDMRQMTQKELKNRLREKEIGFARVSPDDKMTIVAALKDMGEIVAVTGDGVNDAPALRKADIGISMGLTGTDVAREASDIVLMDDNFATIIKAIEEGRSVFENIKKFTTYILSSNIPEIVPYLAYVILGIPLPLTIIQILIVDLGTDMLPALALGADPPEPGILKKPPRSIKERLLSIPLLARSYLFLGPIEAAAAMSGFFWFLSSHGWSWGSDLSPSDPLYLGATTVCLTGIVLTQIANVFVCRSQRVSVFSIPLLSNRLILLGIITEIMLLMLITYTSAGNALAGTSPIPLSIWIFFLPFAITLLFMDEIRKFLSSHIHSGQPHASSLQ